MSNDNFVISVRNPEPDNKKPPFFGNEPGETLYLRVPDGEHPHPEKHAKDPNEWVKELRSLAEAGTYDDDPSNPRSGYTYGDILIFVHGYNNSIEDIMERHDLLQKQLSKKGYNGAIVSFDWPSASVAINYLEDRSDAKTTASRLVSDGIAILAYNQLMQDETRCDIDVHLLGHSTGAYVIREAFYESTQHRRVSRINWHVSQIAFIGGDIARKSMSRSDSKSQSLFTHSARITNYQNPYDSALKVSNVKRLGMAPRVGRVGLPEDTPENVVNVSVGDHWRQLKESESDAGGNWSHSWHFDDPHFAEDLVHTLNGDIDRQKIPTRETRDGELALKPKKRPSKKKAAAKKAARSR